MIANIKNRFYLPLKLLLSSLICACLQQQAIASELPKIGEWGTTMARFEMIDYNINDYKMEHSVLEALIKTNGKDVKAYLEKDNKTLRMFKISYRVPIKLKKGRKAYEEDIVQFGLFRALNPVMQGKIEIKPTQSMPIQFKTNDPLAIIFVVKDETFNAPSLLTDKVKLSHKPNHKHKKRHHND